MSKTAVLNSREAGYKTQAEHHLVETQKILRRLAEERERESRRREAAPSIVDQVRAILRQA